MTYYEKGSATDFIGPEELKEAIYSTLDKLGGTKVLVIPPDFTRYHSFSGQISEWVWEHYRNGLKDVLPALGTHSPMTTHQITRMFGNIPLRLFREHDWRNDIITLGEVPSDFVNEVSEGKVRYPWPAQVNRLLIQGGHDLILSIGQIVPHEVTGMANYNKNIFVGTGGVEGINKSHFLGAVYGLERIMGRADTPVRAVLNYSSEHFARNLPIVYILTVVGKDAGGNLGINGLFIGDDIDGFYKASDLSLQVNFKMLDFPLQKIIVYLDPAEYKSTWLGNKSIYRCRMAIADGAELIILAPGVKEFGEDRTIDKLIRKYGYRTTPEILDQTSKNKDLQENLSAAAHLIHGSSEERFSITYCTENLTRREIESVNYNFADLDENMNRYNPSRLEEGFNVLPDGEKIYYISNPGLGLWSYKERFK